MARLTAMRTRQSDGDIEPDEPDFRCEYRGCEASDEDGGEYDGRWYCEYHLVQVRKEGVDDDA